MWLLKKPVCFQVNRTEDSVHFTMLPKPEAQFIDKTVERRVEAMRSVVDIVRVMRERKNIPNKVCFDYRTLYNATT